MKSTWNADRFVTLGLMETHPDNSDYICVADLGINVVLVLMQCLFESNPSEYRKVRDLFGTHGVRKWKIPKPAQSND